MNSGGEEQPATSHTGSCRLQQGDRAVPRGRELLLAQRGAARAGVVWLALLRAGGGWEPAVSMRNYPTFSHRIKVPRDVAALRLGLFSNTSCLTEPGEERDAGRCAGRPAPAAPLGSPHSPAGPRGAPTPGRPQGLASRVLTGHLIKRGWVFRRGLIVQLHLFQLELGLSPPS